MNIVKLTQMQKELDRRIIEKKQLHDVDRLPSLILALQVELGECANEWRGFKFWSERTTPNNCMVKNIDFKPVIVNPFLEEFVDCFHFILSIGIHLGYELETIELPNEFYYQDEGMTVTEIFSEFISLVPNVNQYHKEEFQSFVHAFVVVLGGRLGFSLMQIEQAYLDKNKVNHKRQDSGY